MQNVWSVLAAFPGDILARKRKNPPKKQEIKNKSDINAGEMKRFLLKIERKKKKNFRQLLENPGEIE